MFDDVVEQPLTDNAMPLNNTRASSTAKDLRILGRSGRCKKFTPRKTKLTVAASARGAYGEARPSIAARINNKHTMISSARRGVTGKIGAAGLEGSCAAVAVCTVMVTAVAGVALPAGSVVGEKVAVAPMGKPVAAKVTASAKLPEVGAGMIWNVAVWPAETVSVADPDTVKVKSVAAGGAVMVSVSEVEMFAVKFISPP